MTPIDTDALKKRMAEKKLSGRELAEHLGISASAAYKYMNGERTPTLEHLIWICQVLGIDDVNVLLRKLEPLDKGDEFEYFIEKEEKTT